MKLNTEYKYYYTNELYEYINKININILLNNNF